MSDSASTPYGSLMVIGIHQRTAPLSVRERLAFTPTELPPALQALRQQTSEALIVSTCNRVEIYAVVEAANDDPSRLHEFIAHWHGIDPEELAPYLYVFSGEAAVHHLFRLAAGLDSMVLGEDQIMGQLKEAQTAARQSGTLGKLLHRLIHSGLAAAKRVRTETRLAAHQVSVVSVALDLARQRLGTLAQRRILIVGAGHIAELILKHLEDEPGVQITLANRTSARAEKLAALYHRQTLPFTDIARGLATTDILITCTAAPEAILGTAAIASAADKQPLLLLDLAVPRNIDIHAAMLPGVTLCDIDTIQEICDANRAARAAEIEHAAMLLREDVAAFMQWWRAQAIVPTIAALREHAETIRAAEVQRTLAHLPELSTPEREAIQALSTAIVNKLLHAPIITLKDPAGGALAPAVRQLFQLPEAPRETYAHES